MDEARLSTEAIGCDRAGLLVRGGILPISEEGKIAKLALVAKAIDSLLKSYGLIV